MHTAITDESHINEFTDAFSKLLMAHEFTSMQSAIEFTSVDSQQVVQAQWFERDFLSLWHKLKPKLLLKLTTWNSRCRPIKI